MSNVSWKAIFVPVRIKAMTGQIENYLFLFDTGATESVISHDVLHESGLSVRDGKGITYALTGGGLVPGFCVEIPELHVFGEKFKKHKIGVSDLLFNEKKGTDEIDGIIGMDIISRFRILIDGPNRKISLTD